MCLVFKTFLNYIYTWLKNKYFYYYTYKNLLENEPLLHGFDVPYYENVLLLMASVNKNNNNNNKNGHSTGQPMGRGWPGCMWQLVLYYLYIKEHGHYSAPFLNARACRRWLYPGRVCPIEILLDMLLPSLYTSVPGPHLSEAANEVRRNYR